MKRVTLANWLVVAPVVLLAVLLLFFTHPAWAGSIDNEKTNFGSACSGTANGVDWDTIFECNGSTWQRGVYFFGNTSATSDSNHAGIVRWNGSNLQLCNGGGWQNVVGQ